MRFLAMAVLFLAFSQQSRADVFDRINTCEQQGGGACVYDLLRELARSQGPGPTGPILATGEYTVVSGACCNGIVTAADRASASITYCGGTVSYSCQGNRCTRSSGGSTADFTVTGGTRFTFDGVGGCVYQHN